MRVYSVDSLMKYANDYDMYDWGDEEYRFDGVTVTCQPGSFYNDHMEYVRNKILKIYIEPYLGTE